MFGDKLGVILFLWIVGAPSVLLLLSRAALRR